MFLKWIKKKTNEHKKTERWMGGGEKEGAGGGGGGEGIRLRQVQKDIK